MSLALTKAINLKTRRIYHFIFKLSTTHTLIQSYISFSETEPIKRNGFQRKQKKWLTKTIDDGIVIKEITMPHYITANSFFHRREPENSNKRKLSQTSKLMIFQLTVVKKEKYCSPRQKKNQ